MKSCWMVLLIMFLLQIEILKKNTYVCRCILGATTKARKPGNPANESYTENGTA